MARTHVVVVLTWMIGGCWSSTAPEQPAVAVTAETAAPTRPAPPGDLPTRTVWQGYYDCAQGTTGVQLTLDRTTTTGLEAIFDFGAHGGNPDLPSGSYRLTGTLREAGTSLVIDLTPDRWILQPTDYIMVGVAVTADRARKRLTGRLLNAECGTISVERVD